MKWNSINKRSWGKKKTDFVEQWLLYLPMMWKMEDGSVSLYSKAGKARLEAGLFLSCSYQENKLFHDMDSLALFSFLTFQGVVVQSTAAIFKNKNAFSYREWRRFPLAWNIDLGISIGSCRHLSEVEQSTHF